MKRYIISLSLIFCIIASLGTSYAAVLEKKVIVKERILARSELKRNVSSGEEYLTQLDAFFVKYSSDTVRLEEILTRVQSAEIKLGNSKQHQELRRIFRYIEYSIRYIFMEDNINPTTPPVTSTGATQNEKTLSEETYLQNLIQTKLTKKEIKIQDIVGNKIEEKTTTNAYFLLGQPNYANLGLKREDYTDSLGDEYLVVVLVTKTEASFQILGYLEKSTTLKTALVKGNYVKKSGYPDSLFVDPKTKDYIITGSTFAR